MIFACSCVRHFLVVRVLHVVRAAAAGGRREVLLVGEHLRHRHLRADDGHRAARVHAGDAAAPAVEIAHQVAGEVAGRVDLDLHHRLEDRRPGARHRVLEGQRPGHLERQLVRVHLVVRAVEHRGLEVDHRVAGEEAAHARVLDALLDRRHELPRDGAAEDVVLELEVAAARQRLDPDLAVAELAVAAGLLLVAAVRLGGRGDRLAVGNPRRLEVDLDAEAAFQLGDGDLDVQLALAGQQQLVRLRIARVADRSGLPPRSRCIAVLILSSSPRLFGSMA